MREGRQRQRNTIMTFGNQPIELARRARGEELNEGKGRRAERREGYRQICSTDKERADKRGIEAATDRSIVDLDMLD